MHIPDGFIDGKTAATTGLLAVVGVGFALRRVRRELPPRRTPFLGLAAAFLFAAQMINFPVAGGTSGHLLGSVLIAALLGPSAAVVVVTTVLIVQCFLFADGGVMALGANVFNMAIVGSAAGYAIFTLLKRSMPGMRGQITAVAFAGWASVVLASISCAGQLAWSGTISWRAVFPAMTAIHMLIGIGEGLISALAYLAVLRTRPDLAQSTVSANSRAGELIGYGLLIVLGLVIFVAPFASPLPDGLEFVAAKLGFEHTATGSVIPVPAGGYAIPGIHQAVTTTAVAGIVGAIVVFGLAVLLGWALVPKRPASSQQQGL